MDEFPCGCLVTDSEWRIVQTNRYLTETLGWPEAQLLGQPLDTILSPASRVFFDSYVLPLMVHEGQCDEIQLALKCQAEGAGTVPMVVNGRWPGGSGDLAYWTLLAAGNRDRLYQELLDARERLEALNGKLSEMAVTDELTQLVNRRELERRAALEFNRARRAGNCLSVVMVDLDCFKEVNDKFGHAEGDAVLREVGAVLATYARAVDVVARYGGEEFMLLLPDTDSEAAVKLTARIHELLHAINSRAGTITASMGVSTYKGEQDIGLQDIIARADSALYHAKETGRNQTTLFPYAH